jgi:hypothetical protein
MALSPQLLQFKSSGVYRLEFDKSVTANIDVETLRLVVGHSKKGPYNTPVLIGNSDEFTNVFGSIDRSLEKKGMFFHRSALEALSRGPILALNLNNFVEGEEANYVAPMTYGSKDSLSADADSSDYADFFDTDKFMTPSDAAVLEAVNSGEHKLINFVNIKQSGITIIVRQAQDVDQFRITAREWYGEGNVPSYLNPFDFMSDFMVDIFVFKGEFDAASMANDPVYGAFFNAEGLIKSQLDQFASLRQVSLEAKYTGSMLPGFKDLEGRNLYVETMVNAEARRTGLFCAINEDEVMDSKLDLVGHSFDADQDYELLSHVVKQNVVTDTITLPAGSAAIPPVATTYTDSTGAVGIVDPVSGDTIGFNVINANLTASITTNDFIIDGNGDYAQITSVSMNGSSTEILSTNLVNGLDVQYLGSTSWNVYDSATGTPAVPGVTTAFGASNSELVFANFDATTEFNVGDFLASAIAGEYVEITAVTATTVTTEADMAASYDGIDTTAAAVDVEQYQVSQGRVIAEDFAGATYAAAGSLFSLTYATAPASIALSVGDYVQAEEAGRLSRVNRISKVGNRYDVYCHANVEATWGGSFVKSFENASDVYKTFVLSGATLMPKNISGVLSVLTGGNGVYDALVDKDAIDFRYVVDTFASYDANGIHNKRNLSQLAKDRQNASAILNAPTVADFKASTDPSFKDNGTFKVQYIADGGNLSLNPSKLYTLPSINEGANYAFYYGPGLIVSDNGKDIIVPPAAYVSNNYIDKYLNALPWSIVAGPRRGVVSGNNVKGAEYSFDKSDRDVLEPFGINPIVFQRGVGLAITGNKTAQQSVRSALSSAHVREVLIYIQEGIADILKDYVFEFNNTQTRLEIKTLVDSFMESVKADGGVYEFKNIMDQTNNTDDVIDNNYGIIDTYVEPVKGLEIVVSRTTVLNTGEISTGNFN